MDFGTNMCKGYAVINLRDHEVAKQLVSNGSLNVGTDGFSKWATFQWAQIQGAAANAQRFIKRHGHLRNARMRPLVCKKNYSKL